ncbi:hypothetical protein BJV82DRAFT_53124 [Fennellomyces sp. T-0311]|nr:hypothetical protein BJV82DRAFT_53124 [Fennellomyces sp. T-0311]
MQTGQRQDLITLLPIEIVSIIFSILQQESHITCLFVSKSWREYLIHNSSLWKTFRIWRWTNTTLNKAATRIALSLTAQHTQSLTMSHYFSSSCAQLYFLPNSSRFKKLTNLKPLRVVDPLICFMITLPMITGQVGTTVIYFNVWLRPRRGPIP